jgi:hypothetical protein
VEAVWLNQRYERYLSQVEHMVERLNKHLPKTRKTLGQLLREEEPSVEAVDGSKICFRRQDIETVAKVMPAELHGSLFLPIVVVRRLELGKGVYFILGGRAEKALVSRLLNLDEGEKDLYLYRLQVFELLGKLKSLLTIAFDLPPTAKLS